jgi:hypothetical protein
VVTIRLVAAEVKCDEDHNTSGILVVSVGSLEVTVD